jgi:hypothetical protein
VATVAAHRIPVLKVMGASRGLFAIRISYDLAAHRRNHVESDCSPSTGKHGFSPLAN